MQRCSPPRERFTNGNGRDWVTIDDIRTLAAAIRGEVAKAVIGQDATVDLMLVALFSGGHILLEGPPGTAKTLLAHSFAEAVGLKFGRIQFTPDLMPGDIIGANLFNFQTSTFRSEEHTSQLQSLMRTSYAVFCWQTNHKHNGTQHH